MAAPFTGGCRCKAVRYECSAEPLLSVNCHCRDCQMFSGGPFAANLAVPRDAVKITGEVKYYDVPTDSGNTLSRGFCPTCGSSLFAKPSGIPHLLVITAGSLDDPSWYRPTMDIYTSSAQPWAYMNPALAKFPKMPPF